MRQIFRWMIFGILVLGLPSFGGAKTNSSAFLKLNGYYLPYIGPVPPFLGSSGHVIVPLQTTARLMGLAVTADQGGRRIRITQARRSIRASPVLLLEIGKRRARIDGRNLILDATPTRVRSGVVLAPIRSLIQAFGLQATWDSGFKVLSLSNEGMMKADDLDQLEHEIDFSGYPDYDKFVPIAFSIGVETSRGVTWHTLTLTFRRIAGDTSEGQPVLLGLARYKSGVNTILTDIQKSPDVAPGGDPCTRTTTEMRCKVRLDSLNDSLDYVVVRILLKR